MSGVQIKGSIRDSVWSPEFDMKHMKRAEEHNKNRTLYIYANKIFVLTNKMFSLLNEQHLFSFLYIHRVNCFINIHFNSAKFVTQKESSLHYLSFGLFYCYGISTIVGYLMPNSTFTPILNIWFLNIFCRYIELNNQTVLCQTIQLSISQQSWMFLSLALYHLQFNWTSDICLNIVKLSNNSISNNSVERKLTKLNVSKYSSISLTT